MLCWHVQISAAWRWWTGAAWTEPVNPLAACACFRLLLLRLSYMLLICIQWAPVHFPRWWFRSVPQHAWAWLTHGPHPAREATTLLPPRLLAGAGCQCQRNSRVPWARAFPPASRVRRASPLVSMIANANPAGSSRAGTIHACDRAGAGQVAGSCTSISLALLDLLFSVAQKSGKEKFVNNGGWRADWPCQLPHVPSRSCRRRPCGGQRNTTRFDDDAASIWSELSAPMGEAHSLLASPLTSLSTWNCKRSVSVRFFVFLTWGSWAKFLLEKD